MSLSPIGIDIQPTEICFIQLKRHRHKVMIQHAISKALPPGAVLHGKIQHHDEVSACIQTLVKQTKTKGQNAAIALPTQSIFTKKIHFPKHLTPKEIEKEIHNNISLYFPDVSEELCFDYILTKEEGALSHPVWIVAGRQNQLISYTGIIEQAALKARWVDVVLYAHIRAIYFFITQIEKSAIVVILSKLYLSVHLIVLRNNVLLFHQEIQCVSLNDFCSALKETITVSFTHHSSIRCKRIYISGMTQEEREQIWNLLQEWAIETFFIYPFHSIAQTALMQNTFTNQFLIGYGLALRGWNF